MKTDLIELYGLMGKSNEYTELCIIKEFLILQMDNILKEQAPYYTDVKIPSHHINILHNAFEDRHNHLNAILKNVLFEIEKLEK